MPEDPQVRELVDHDGLEGFRRREDESPRERQPACARSAAPPRPLIADRDCDRSDGESRRVTLDFGVDRVPRTWPKPRFQHARERTAVDRSEMDDKLVLIGATDALHGRATSPCRGGHHPKAMEVAPKPDLRAVPETATRRDDGTLVGHPLEMSTQPRLALGEEGADVSVRIGP